ncbi:putative adenine phosphoribosyltransferase [Helianthus debilis subsp. tardiflorus]
MFQDITTLLLDPKAFKDTIDLFVERYKHQHISVIAAAKADRSLLVEACGLSLSRSIQIMGGIMVVLVVGRKASGVVMG